MLIFKQESQLNLTRCKNALKRILHQTLCLIKQVLTSTKKIGKNEEITIYLCVID